MRFKKYVSVQKPPQTATQGPLYVIEYAKKINFSHENILYVTNIDSITILFWKG
jgi:hypothetical protein